jgi:hypothetical protein
VVRHCLAAWGDRLVAGEPDRLLGPAGFGIRDLAWQGGVDNGLVVLSAADHGRAAPPWLSGQVDVTLGMPVLRPVSAEADGAGIHLAEDQHAHRADVDVQIHAKGHTVDADRADGAVDQAHPGLFAAAVDADGPAHVREQGRAWTPDP